MNIYYRKMSKPVKVCYLISAIAFILTFMVSVFVLYNVVPSAANLMSKLLNTFSVIVAVICVLIVSILMSKAVLATELEFKGNNSFLYQIKRFAFIIVCMVGFGLVADIAGGMMLPFILNLFLSSLRQSNFAIFSFIIKLILFLLLWLPLTRLIRGHGDGDCSEREFNPHLMIIAVLLGLVILMPSTVYDHMYENTDVQYTSGIPSDGGNQKGKISYNVQAVFSQNQDLYKNMNFYKNTYELNQKFSIAWVIVSIILSSAVQVFIAALLYHKGRKDYYKRHPNLLKAHFPDEKI